MLHEAYEGENGELLKEHPFLHTLKPAVQGMHLEGHPQAVHASLLEEDCLSLGTPAPPLRSVSL